MSTYNKAKKALAERARTGGWMSTPRYEKELATIQRRFPGSVKAPGGAGGSQPSQGNRKSTVPSQITVTEYGGWEAVDDSQQDYNVLVNPTSPELTGYECNLSTIYLEFREGLSTEEWKFRITAGLSTSATPDGLTRDQCEAIEGYQQVVLSDTKMRKRLDIPFRKGDPRKVPADAGMALRCYVLIQGKDVDDACEFRVVRKFQRSATKTARKTGFQ